MIASLRVVLAEAIELNKADALVAAGGDYAGIRIKRCYQEFSGGTKKEMIAHASQNN